MARLETDTLALALMRRAAGDSGAYETWEAVTNVARTLVLAATRHREVELVPAAWSLTCGLAARLPPPDAVRVLPPSLLDAADRDALLARRREAAHALVAALSAPADADGEALLADVAATIAGVSPLLARWRDDLPHLPAAPRPPNASAPRSRPACRIPPRSRLPRSYGTATRIPRRRR